MYFITNANVSHPPKRQQIIKTFTCSTMCLEMHVSFMLCFFTDFKIHKHHVCVDPNNFSNFMTSFSYPPQHNPALKRKTIVLYIYTHIYIYIYICV